MILSDTTIRQLCIVDPCMPAQKFRGKTFGLSHAGYDVRVDIEGGLAEWYGYTHVQTPDGDGVSLKPGQSILLGTLEHFTMPDDVVGYVRDKSTWARQGLFNAQGVLEPGWSGHLSVRVVNHGNEPLTIVHGEPIAQVVFHQMDRTPERLYTGKYSNQQRGAQGARLEP